MAAEPCNVGDYERVARERLPEGAYGYFAGGADDECALADNIEGWRRWTLRPRVLVDVSETNAATTVLDTPISMPVLVAPVAIQRMAHDDGEAGMARAAAAAGTIMVVSSLATTSLADIAAAAPDAPRWFQVYRFRDSGVTQALIDQASDAGYQALVLTVDAPRLGRRERDVRTGFALPPEVTVPSFAAATGGSTGGTPSDLFALMDASVTWRDLEELASSTDLPVLVKGVMTAEDAQLACEHGAAGVVVSNHGGRQLDCVGPTVDALPEVAEAVEGRAEVLVDGGVRRGADAVRALALGAGAVLAGRAPLWGLAAGGEQGAREVLEMLRGEVELALALTGCARPEAVTRAHVKRRP